jgi:endonuclease III
MPNPITDALIARAAQLSQHQQNPYPFTGNATADTLLNDLAHHPHAFVLACIMDRRMVAENVWLIPYLLQQRLGSFSFANLAALSHEGWTAVMTEPTPLHRHSRMMAKNAYLAVERIQQQYAGEASRIWQHTSSSATVVLRFLAFSGVGIKIATMAANILCRDLNIPFSDRYSLDVSPDTHVLRVFPRLFDLDRPMGDIELIYFARSHHPEYPGIFDLPLWEIGRTWCFPTDPNCPQCSFRNVCRYHHKTGGA